MTATVRRGFHVSALVAATAVLALGISIGGMFLIFSALAVIAIATTAWVATDRAPKDRRSLPRWAFVAVAIYMVSGLLPVSIAIAVQISVLVGAVICWSRAATGAPPRVRFVASLTLVILALWLVLTVHPNVPSLMVGLQGFRKSTLCLTGLLLGLALPPEIGRRLAICALRVLAALLATSILIYFAAPGLEAAVSRSAGEYTSLYAGERRLQGLFAGPFHVAMAGTLLVLYGVWRFAESRLEASLLLALGLLSVTLSLVRTGFVALALAIVVMAVCSATLSSRVRRTAVTTVILVSGAMAATSWGLVNSELFSSLGDPLSDSRFTGRFTGWRENIQVAWESPFVGWGAGSAGDALGSQFSGGVHVTSHNVLLKFFFEGGIAGALLWLLLLAVLASSLVGRSDQARLGAGAFTAVMVMGMTIASVEALPVSAVAFLLVGWSLKARECEGPSPRSHQAHRSVPRRVSERSTAP